MPKNNNQDKQYFHKTYNLYYLLGSMVGDNVLLLW